MRQKVPVVTAASRVWATATLVALNIAAFAVTAVQSESVARNNRASELFLDWVLWPPLVAQGEWIRLIGSGFLHYGPLHLVANMFALYIVGQFVEATIGPARYFAIYFVSMLGGSALVMLFSQGEATAGASGAIFGLFGAELAILLRMRQSPLPALMIIFINAVITFSVPGISIWGHVGGLAAGTAAGFGLLFGPKRFGWVAIGGVGAVALALIGVGITQLQR